MEALNSNMFMWCKETIHHLLCPRLRTSTRFALKYYIKWAQYV